MKNRTTLSLVFCGMFAALTAVASQISIPIGLVPINLATLAVFLAGGVLGAKKGAASQAVFLVLGFAGLPVFANFRGGAAALVGPTGGYLIGYVAAAWLVGSFCDHFGRKPLELTGFLIAGLAICYFLGTAWFMFVTKNGLWSALTLCVFPFLVGDALKIAAALVLIPRLARIFDNTDVKNPA